MMLLYGIMVAQAYTYYKSSYSGDNRLVHILVSGALPPRTIFNIQVSPSSGASDHVCWDSLFPINHHCTHSPSRCRFAETFHTAIVVAFIYITSVTDYGQPWTLNAAHWTGKWSVSIASLNIAIIQVSLHHKLGRLTSAHPRSGIFCLACTMPFWKVDYSYTLLDRVHCTCGELNRRRGPDAAHNPAFCISR